MSNMNVKKRLESVSDELDKIIKHVAQYSGVDAGDARFVDNLATGIAEQATRLASFARTVQGDKSASKMSSKVRKALGFTYR